MESVGSKDCAPSARVRIYGRRKRSRLARMKLMREIAAPPAASPPQSSATRSSVDSPTRPRTRSTPVHLMSTSPQRANSQRPARPVAVKPVAPPSHPMLPPASQTRRSYGMSPVPHGMQALASFHASVEFGPWSNFRSGVPELNEIRTAGAWPDGAALGRGTPAVPQPQYAQAIANKTKTVEGRPGVGWAASVAVGDWVTFKIPARAGGSRVPRPPRPPLRLLPRDARRRRRRRLPPRPRRRRTSQVMDLDAAVATYHAFGTMWRDVRRARAAGGRHRDRRQPLA